MPSLTDAANKAMTVQEAKTQLAKAQLSSARTLQVIAMASVKLDEAIRDLDQEVRNFIENKNRDPHKYLELSKGGKFWTAAYATPVPGTKRDRQDDPAELLRALKESRKAFGHYQEALVLELQGLSLSQQQKSDVASAKEEALLLVCRGYVNLSEWNVADIALQIDPHLQQMPS